MVRAASRAQPENVAGPGQGGEGDSQAEVLVTIHGRVFTGTLRQGARLPEHDEWRWCVEIRVDDRRLMTWVAADQVEFVGPRETDST